MPLNIACILFGMELYRYQRLIRFFIIFVCAIYAFEKLWPLYPYWSKLINQLFSISFTLIAADYFTRADIKSAFAP